MYNQFFQQQLDALHQDGNYRVFTDLERRGGKFPLAHDHTHNKEITIWCNNDYLGMAQEPAVVHAMVETAQTMGVGSGGTRNIAGTHHPVVQLENELSSLHNKPSALVFSSGYVANATALSTLGKMLPNAVIFSDSCNHASMIEGIRYAGCEKHVFRHNDLAHLEQLLGDVDYDRPKIIAFESVYSMDGDMAPIGAICDLAKRYNALTYLDEVHAVGLYGQGGAGLASQQGVMEHVDLIQGTLAKAFGVVGGYIAASRDLVDFVRSFGAGFIFSTTMPPPVAAACLASVQQVRKADDKRALLHQQVAQTKASLIKAGIPVMENSVSHIVPVLVGDAERCRKASDMLLQQHNIFVQHINYPTVPWGTERLRITPTPLHSEAMIIQLTAALVDVFGQLNLALKEAA